MIALDTNILVYAHRRDSAFHGPAARFLKVTAEGTDPWAIPYPCLHEFLAIVTHPKIYKPASTLGEAAAQIDEWVRSPSFVWIGELRGHWESLKQLWVAAKVSGGAVHDIRLAAICLEHNVRVLYSADRDFNRIKGLVVKNPLVS